MCLKNKLVYALKPWARRYELDESISPGLLSNKSYEEILKFIQGKVENNEDE